MSDSWCHGLQPASLLCFPPSPRVCSNSCLLRQWCYLTISSFVAPLLFCLQSFPTSGSFPMSWPFTLHGQSNRALSSASVLPMNIKGWSPYDWSPCSPRDCQESSQAPQFEHINCSVLVLLYGQMLILIHDYWKKTLLWIYGASLAKWYLCF